MTTGNKRRWHRRHAYVSEVRVVRVGEFAQRCGSTVDVGTGGCGVCLDVPVDYEIGCEVEVCLKGITGSFIVLGTVRRLEDDGRALGISFSTGSWRGRQDLQRLIGRLEQTAVDAVAG